MREMTLIRVPSLKQATISQLSPEEAAELQKRFGGTVDGDTWTVGGLRYLGFVQDNETLEPTLIFMLGSVLILQDDDLVIVNT